MTDLSSSFESFQLYGVTDVRKNTSSEDLLQKIDYAYKGGADIIQLRSKELNDLEFIRLGKKVREIATHYQKFFFVNDRLDLAWATEADGLHVGQDDMPVSVIRSLCQK